jgi:hypothetical protein
LNKVLYSEGYQKLERLKASRVVQSKAEPFLPAEVDLTNRIDEIEGEEYSFTSFKPLVLEKSKKKRISHN